MRKSRTQYNKRIVRMTYCAIVVLLLLLVRTAWIQIVDGERLSRAALEQQTSDNTVSAKRGKIFDRNYKVLASNTSVETISITPADLRKSIEAKRLTSSRVADQIATILGLDAQAVEKKINKESSFEYLKKKVEKDIADDLRVYIEETGLRGISFVEDVKRFYPYNNLASHVIGFVGDDNQGLEGVESIFDDTLSGVPGRVITTQQATGMETGSGYESYIEAQDGNSVVLTIDEVIQGYVEKHLENARVSNKLEIGAAAIVMDVNTGEILAMSSKPDYDLNEPFAITDPIREKFEDIDKELKELEGAEYNQRLTEVIQTVRRNKAVVDSYEPGSTFKAMVASVAVETGSVNLETDQYSCGGSYRVADRSINCANRNGHGTQTFAEAVQNSCNPGFIQIGAKIGKEKFLTGARAFGFFEKTGIELPGETAGIGFSLNNFTELDLATSSFGQSITVTPLQMITAISAVANGGKLYKPHLIKEIIDSDNIVIEKKEPQVVRQVISKETSETMRGILESVVSKGGGKNAYIAGYRIAGKTGTSEKHPRGNGKYIASFLSFAPADDPQIACLVILDQPAIGMPYYGGTIAAPVVKHIMEETLQYLEVEPRYNEEEKAYVDMELPDLSGKSKEEAAAVLKEAGFKIRYKGSGETVTDQIPKAYTRLGAGSTVVAYLGGTKAERTVTVPDVIGESASSASAMLIGEGLNARIRGVPGLGGAVCSSQSPEAGTIVEPGTVVTVNFKYQGALE